jgi:undecaprenyl-diphosphatase
MSGTSAMIARLLLVGSLLGPVLDLDARVQQMAQAARSPQYERVMRGATDIGRPAVLFGALLAIAVFTGPLGPATAREALYVLLPTNVVVEILKRAVNRARPDGEHKRSNASFPSSHAANAAALAAVLSARWGRGRWAFWLAALLVGWSRIYLNRHFLSDVLVGVAIGVLCAWLIGRRTRAARRTGVPSRFRRWASRDVAGGFRVW